MNPRIQVEHTVTEEVTDVDLVQSQLRIAAGETLADLGLSQESVTLRGAALQCRITTEDPANGFRPDTGRISAYRSPGGSGIRLDGGTTHAGTEISAHFDSMLVKLTCRGRDFATAVGRARRAVAEFRIRGVATNIPFLQAVLDDPDFQAGRVTTSFIEQRLQLLTARHSADRGTKLLTYLADVTVNKPHGERPDLIDPLTKLPEAPAASRRVPAAPRRARPRGLRPLAARVADRRRHRHHLPRRPPVAARHPRPHQDLLAVAPVVAHTLPELLSWSAGAAPPTTSPCASSPRTLGAARRAARGRAEHLPPDAAARPQHRRLHAVPDGGDRRLRSGGRRHRRRRLPHLRRAQRRLPDAARHRRRPRDRHVRGGGRPLLHLRPVRPVRAALHAGLLPAARRADRRRRRARPGREGHGGPAAGARGGEAGVGAAPGVRPAGAPAHA